jgi:hypothetical protein
MADQSNNKKTKKGGAGPLWFSILLAGIVVISPSTIMMLIFGLLPTWASFLTDRSPEKYASFCIGGMNFSGLFPFLMELWMGEHSLSAATDIMTDVFNLGIMYSAAAFGWLMFTFIPPIVGAFLTVLSQRRIATLRNEQRQLIEEWGEAVTRSKEQEEAMAAQPRPAGPVPSSATGD